MRKSRILVFLIHTAAWLVFFSLPLIFIPLPPEIQHGNLKLQYTIFSKFLTSNILLISIFYLNSQVLVPRLFFRKKYLLYFFILVALFTGFLAYGTLLFPSGPHYSVPGGSRFITPERLNAIYLFIVVVFISGGIRIVQDWLDMEKKNKMIEAERLQTELSFLQAQINPHFLFNTLNSIYGLALMQSNLTADAVMRLSSLMRYILQDVNSEKVPLEAEIQSIQHYVELQKLRLSKTIDIQLIISGDPGLHQIPPLILMGFVENAFKYGTSTHESAAIMIDIEIDGVVLNFTASNNVFAGREKSESFGIGMKNSERRLNLLYPGKHNLSIVNNGKIFQLHLNIHLE